MVCGEELRRMSPTRRDFMKATAATAASLAASTGLELDAAAQTLSAPSADPFAVELANQALNAATGAGASYADVRIGRSRPQAIGTRERQITAVTDSESYGLGVRTLLNGCWGFAATSTMTRARPHRAPPDAGVMARAARAGQARRVERAPIPPAAATWITPVTRDPLDVPI